MFPHVLLVLIGAATSAATAGAIPFEITNNKPFVQVWIDGRGPEWFILDSGCRDGSIVARDCAERLGIASGADSSVNVGAGSGVDVRLAQASDPVTLRTLGDTLTVANPRILTLGHVARYEGRQVDGLLGDDFLMRHVVEVDYAARTITLHAPARFTPPARAAIVPLDLETGWAIARGSITPPGGSPIPGRFIIDTGVRGVVTLFRPFAERHGLLDARGTAHDVVVGGGAGGISRGDVGRVAELGIGPLRFANAIAMFSRDTTGVFAQDEPQGIVGGELLRRHRVTFDYPHRRMLLEPYDREPAFDYDMSGLFLAAEGPELDRIRILAVQPGTPGADAGLRADDEIVALDGRRGSRLGLDDARAAFRRPGVHELEVRRENRTMRVRLTARRLV